MSTQQARPPEAGCPKFERQQQEQWQQSGKLALALEEQADQYQQQLALLMDKLTLQENVATGMAARVSELEKTSRLKTCRTARLLAVCD